MNYVFFSINLVKKKASEKRSTKTTKKRKSTKKTDQTEIDSGIVIVEDDFDACEDDDYNYSGAPIATFFVEQSSGGEYYITVIQVSKQEDLAGFKYYLKDDKGSTYVGGNGFGEVALQMISNEEHGVEQTYNGDDDQLSSRASNISADDGSEFPVHFNDNDRDGKLSAGDQFTVVGTGNSANGPAGSGWKLDIQFDATGDIIGWGELN